jgi:Uma2 family endonuclease
MSQTTDERIHWTTSDIELLPESSNRYEIIDGELFVTRAPHWKHQKTCGNVGAELRDWSLETGLGEAVTAPGLIFTDADNVIPDVVWISKTRLAVALDEAGHLTIAPELAIEALWFQGCTRILDSQLAIATSGSVSPPTGNAQASSDAVG